MKIILLDAKTLGDDIPLTVFSDMGEFVSYPTTSPEEAPGRIADADVIVTNKVKFSRMVQNSPFFTVIREELDKLKN